MQRSGTICAILVAGIEKHFCEFIFNLHQCTKRCLAILIFSSGGHKVCTILVEGIMRVFNFL